MNKEEFIDTMVEEDPEKELERLKEIHGDLEEKLGELRSDLEINNNKLNEIQVMISELKKDIDGIQNKMLICQELIECDGSEDADWSDPDNPYGINH